MKLAFGCDPNAAELKATLMAAAQAWGHDVTDLGSDDPIYANVATDVAEKVVSGEYDRGILLCGTGIGVSIAANRVKGAYCACVADAYQAERATLSNNANLIAMGAQVLGAETAKLCLKLYLDNEFDPSSRSGVKVARIAEYEDEHSK
ncbi:MAG: RpiB/LacA/LacB family sugar-phosphate isomerase [Actinomycetaceae bacterium]|nr:RpiB/LacA/LacB family sugar-phosphate isomerase [Arcanobacterium sp.]MDD7686378.1 RpiB/LacA/LacB family sugar-phosphate isomerase [Actinomycetaceae bacterium]MDY5272658.1 RpiB/LacA/LacB family sugar-phosphate isomerase [Arcanobacterium sp.]